MGSDGSFVVTWESEGSSGTDTSSFSVQGQRYASDGSTQAGEFQANTYTTGLQWDSVVTMDADGDFVVVWRGNNIQGQRYASDGSAQGAQFQVSSTGIYPAVATEPDGDFVAVWTGPPHDIRGQRYASNGSVLGAAFLVNSYTTGYQEHPAVAADADGDFVVVWNSVGSQGTDTSYRSIQGQRYASNGSKQGGEFQVNTYTMDEQLRPSVAAVPGGEFLVVWHSIGSFLTDSSSESIQGQLYSSDGSTRGGQFQVNTYTTGAQRNPSVASDAGGDFTVVWWSVGSSGTDTSSASIQAQRYSLPGAPPVPAMSRATRFALVTALLLLGAAYALRRRA